MPSYDDDNVDLGELLRKPVSSFQRVDLPAGVWFHGKLVSMEADVARNEKRTPFYRFHMRITEPGKDVPKKWLDELAATEFSLSDYDVISDFYLTGRALSALSNFVVSIGYSPNVNVFDVFKLDSDFKPTPETQEVIRGVDVMFRFEAAPDGRVYPRASSFGGITGVARTR